MHLNAPYYHVLFALCAFAQTSQTTDYAYATNHGPTERANPDIF